jgi:hypothetical protein
MNSYEHYIKFTQTQATSTGTIAYLNKMIYAALIANDPENEESPQDTFASVNSKDELAAIEWLSALDKQIITKVFENTNLTSLYVRGFVDTQLSDEARVDLNTFIDNGVTKEATSLAFTLVLSPTIQDDLSGQFKGIIVKTVSEAPFSEGDSQTISVYDPLNEGQALGILARFLTATTFTNMQFSVMNEYTGIPNTGLIDTLKENKITFIFNDEINNVLGMAACGSKEMMHPYIGELWKYNVREKLHAFLQTKNPTYINENLHIIEHLIDGVNESFLLEGYFESYKKTVVPLKENQLASDVDLFLVNNVAVEYNSAGAIWNISINVSEALS